MAYDAEFYPVAQDLYGVSKQSFMDSTELRQKWPTIKEKIKEQHPNLADEDLHYEFGKESELLLRLQEKLGKTNKEIKDWLSIMG